MLKHVEFKAREEKYIADGCRAIGKGIVEVVKKGVDATKELANKQIGNFFTAANDYRKAHPDVCNSLQNAEQVFSAFGVGMDVGQIAAGAAVGAEAGGVAGAVGGAVVTGTKIAGTRYFVEKAISKGEDSFTNLAMKYAVGDEQKAEFKETAKFIYSTAVTGASAAGMAKGALRGPKSGTPSTSKAPKSSTAVHEMELVGTGRKVKVPVKEHGEVLSVSRKLESQGLGGEPAPKILPKEVEVPNKTRSSQLLPGEGEVGTYKALSDSGNKGDNVTPDHIPSAAFMSKFGKKKSDGICMKTEHYYPGEGGRHRASRTYGNTQNSESTLSPRSELATDIWDRKKIYQEDGLYDSTIRESLQDVIKQNKETFPDMFEKGKK
jgi:hypothetical protein